MKLYLYHHCPYCVRAEMVAGWRGVAVEKVYLHNDDEQAHFDLIGAKMVPILQFDDGRAMGESMDIVAELDVIDTGAPALDPWNDLAAQMSVLDAISHNTRCLLFPRNVRLGLPEFETQSAIDYFTVRKEETIGMSFAEALAETATHKSEVETALAAMPPIPLPGAALRTGDVFLFPVLRNLTMVKDLAMPDWMRAYVDHVALGAQVETYWDRAI